MRKSLAVVMFLCSSLLAAQEVKPTNLSFLAVVGQTSPQQTAAFFNKGTTQLSLTISVEGPFAIPVNDCGRGVKPGTHCNVFVTYTPAEIGQDTGLLTFNYGEGTAMVTLSGSGVSAIGTELDDYSNFRDQYRLGHGVNLEAKFFIDVDPKEGYDIPYGESVFFSCSNGSETVNLGTSPIQRACNKRHCPAPAHGKVESGFVPDQTGQWQCTATYPGDGVFGPTSTSWSFLIVAK